MKLEYKVSLSSEQSLKILVDSFVKVAKEHNVSDDSIKRILHEFKTKINALSEEERNLANITKMLKDEFVKDMVLHNSVHFPMVQDTIDKHEKAYQEIKRSK